MKKEYSVPIAMFRELRLREKIADVCWAYVNNPTKLPLLYFNPDGLAILGYWKIEGFIYPSQFGNGCDGAEVQIGYYENGVWKYSTTKGGTALWIFMKGGGNSAEPFQGFADVTYTENGSKTGADP